MGILYFGSSKQHAVGVSYIRTSYLDSYKYTPKCLKFTICNIMPTKKLSLARHESNIEGAQRD